MTPREQRSSALPAIALASAHAIHLQNDRKMLRKLGYETLLLHQRGVELARELPGKDIALIVCDERLADMSGLDFVRLIRLHPGLRTLPLLLVSTDSTREAVLEAKSAGCTGYVLRPYALATFASQVARSLHKADGNALHAAAEADASAFAAALERYTTPPEPEIEPWVRALETAQALLTRKRYNEAEEMFRQSLDLKPEQAEARLGLATIWRAKGFMAEFREDMERAAAALAREGRINEAGQVVEELRRFNPGLPDPRRHAASDFIRSHDYQAAAKALSAVIEKGKDADGLYSQVARDCHFTDNPLQTARKLCDALAQTTDPTEARKLWERIAGIEPSRTVATAAPRMRSSDSAEKKNSSGFTSRFGALLDVLAVARFTFSAYRSGGVQGRA